MNRKERRASVARGKGGADLSFDIATFGAEAALAFRQGRLADAEVICNSIVARSPAHAPTFNLLGLIHHTGGRYRRAVKTFAAALAINDQDAASHYNIAISYQALQQREAAVGHFKKAIVLGLSGKDIEHVIVNNAAVAGYISRFCGEDHVPEADRLPDEAALAAIANEVFLQCALETAIIRGTTLEQFLTRLRGALLGLAASRVLDQGEVDRNVVSLASALAQQCFLNEYVFAQDEVETLGAARLREMLEQGIADGAKVSPFLLAAVACYVPLYRLAVAPSLLAADWPRGVADLLRVQVREPLEEARDRPDIRTLTPIDDDVSVEVMRQYEENPYPRWVVNPLAAARARLGADLGAVETAVGAAPDVLIAGCGSGEHPFDVAQKNPRARVLAVDLSLTSLAYARRKTREEGLSNIEYAQADILRLDRIGRTFDRVEAVGVLHHLADPLAGWRVLLSLLAPDGIMRIGLYSEAARRSVVEALALIAAQGYSASADDIRTFRQRLIGARNEPRWDPLLRTVDFYTLSGCRDMLFNVMEHRFTIPRIAAFLKEQGLVFEGFELDAGTIERFARNHPGAAALANLDNWHAFEAANPHTFRHMYVFTVRRG